MDAIFLLLTIGSGGQRLQHPGFRRGRLCEGTDVRCHGRRGPVFSLEAASLKALQDTCQAWGVGIQRRLEAPQDLRMEIQKEALQQTEADKLLGLEITEGYMYRPLKTSLQRFCDHPRDTSVFRAGHKLQKMSKSHLWFPVGGTGAGDGAERRFQGLPAETASGFLHHRRHPGRSARPGRFPPGRLRRSPAAAENAASASLTAIWTLQRRTGPYFLRRSWRTGGALPAGQ